MQGLKIAAATRIALKRKREDEEQIKDPKGPGLPTAPTTLSHEFVAPADYRQPDHLDPSVYGSHPTLFLLNML